MKWDRVEYDDGDGYYWTCDTGRGDEICIDKSGDGWILFAWERCGDIRISAHASVEEAKAAAVGYVDGQIVRWQNVKAQGFVHVDDGN